MGEDMGSVELEGSEIAGARGQRKEGTWPFFSKKQELKLGS